MTKRKIIIYSLLALTLVGLMCIIFFPNYSKDNQNEKPVFATSISVSDNSRSINIMLGNAITFGSEPYVVEPKNCNQKVEVQIVDSLGRLRTDSTFINNHFETNSVGSHYLNFKVLSTRGVYIYDTIKINVKEHITDEISAIVVDRTITTIYENEAIDLDSLIEVSNHNTDNIRYKCDGKILSSSCYLAKEMGNHQIEVCLCKDGYQISCNLSLIVNSGSTVRIKLQDSNSNNLSTNSSLYCAKNDGNILLQYFIENRINQIIDIQIEDTNVLQLQSCNSPIIVVKPITVGSSKITISANNASFVLYVIIT